MPLTFTLKKNPSFKVDCRKLTPDKLEGLSIKQILEITLSNTYKVIDLFEISGDSVEQVVFKNSTHQLDYIGHQMSRGNITIEGDCGEFLGANMRGGSIICNGNAGDRVGDQMRRGMILIDGKAGDYCGSRMLAGTIGVFGNTGNYVGFGMKRGTILLTQMPTIHATIQDCGTHTLPFLALLFKSFRAFSTPFNRFKSLRAQRYAGDLACNGNGEILICNTDISA
jgi:formylmethanofuran dehydrogenase subunit C